MGALHIQLAKMSGARVIVSELDPVRMDVARKMGADIVINAGEADPIAQVKELTEGRGVAGLVDNMPQMERTGLTVTQLMGSESRREYNLEVDSILHRFARKLSALPQPLYAPVLVSNAELRESIVREPYYQEAYAVMKRCTVAVVGIGTATTYEQYITGANRQPGTAAAGAAAPVGEICTHCFDADGQPVEFPFSNRILAISREDYKNIPTRIGIAGGPEKLAAIRAALRGGYVNVLITDLDTAAALLDETCPAARSPRCNNKRRIRLTLCQRYPSLFISARGGCGAGAPFAGRPPRG